MRDAVFDFFENVDLPTPALTDTEAEAILRDRFGIAGTVHPLGSQQDQNFLVDGGAAVLKVSNPAFSPQEIDLSDLAADHIAARSDLRVATVLRGTDGSPLRTTVSSAGEDLDVRMLRFLDGGTLTGSAYLSPAVVARMGEIAATVSLALAGLEHPAQTRSLQWNPLNAQGVVDRLAPFVSDDGLRARVVAAAAAASATLLEVAGDLPQQLCHLDLTDDNLVRDPASGLPDGIIDFGDVSRSWAVGELASTLSCILHHAGAQPASVLPAVRAFHRARPLSDAEAGVLWPLVVLRAAVLVVSGEHQLTIDPANEYAAAGSVRERLIFDRATSIPTSIVTDLLRDSIGVRSPRAALNPGHRIVEGGARPVVLDLGAASAHADDGAWLEPGLADRLAASAMSGGAQIVTTSFAAARMDRARTLRSEAPETVATGIDVWFAVPTEIVSPAAGIAVTGDGVLTLALDDLVLRIDGLDDPVSGEVTPGSRLGAATRITVQLRAADAPTVPPFVRPDHADGWLASCVDPAPLVGGAAAPPREHPVELLSRRTASLADVQEHYYADPPRIERGWRHHLVDDRGRVYLDMVNNVTSVGHAHPRITAAVSTQLRRLNTNSRFHYGAIAEFAERLAALLPDPLDTVFLVNSGSEAVDLAVRIAMAATGRRDVVAVREAYHGWTYASDAVSTSVADNPGALGSRPDWVHTVEAPNPFRGRLRGADAAGYAAAAASEISRLAASGRPPAAFLSETLFGNAGGIALPDGYLREVYSAVRAVGGLAIADEVQVGYGRLGDWFWGFEQQRVVPDVVAVAKSMGNGYPLGAVITSREVADRYRTQGYFFSSTGGSPVSSVVGTTVLDIIRDEGLQANARDVGAALRRGLDELAGRHPLIGAVHGHGLYLGLELVRDRETRAPAPIETAALCERLRELGVIMQPTGDHQNVLKIKPPLCVDAESVGFFVAMVDRALHDVIALDP